MRIYAYYRFVVMPNVKKPWAKTNKVNTHMERYQSQGMMICHLFFPALNIFTFYVQMVTRAIETLTLFVAEQFTSLGKTARRVGAAN